jgi:hypothetical protein
MVIKAVGRLSDGDRELLFATLDPLLADHAVRSVDIDLARATLAEVTGVELLRAAYDRASAYGVRLRLTHAAGVVAGLLEINGVAPALYDVDSRHP